MIHSFSCKNFYSFGDLTTLDFVVNDNAPENYGYFVAPSGTRLSKVETIIGSNASGKTNLLKVLPFFKWLIVTSFTMPPEFPIAVQSFAFGEKKDQQTELSVVFEVDKKIYTYSFILDKTKIFLEELKLTSMAKEKMGTKTLFVRTWNPQSAAYTFDGEGFGLPKGFENLNLLRKNASVISAAARLNHKESQEIAEFWQGLETNASETGWMGDPMLNNAMPQWFDALVFYNDNKALKEKAEKLLSRFDLGLAGINIDKKPSGNGFQINITGIHSYNGQEQALPIIYESSGTKQLFVLLKSILQVLDKGGIAVFDEMDSSLHPEILLSLFDLFIQPETNPKNAQLLFSTHSHIILSKLDKYQLVFVEKNQSNESESWRLDEVSGVRADDNYYAKYMAGAYGAVPKL